MSEPSPTRIGRIVRLQVQVRSLKQPGPRFRRYDPTGIREALALALDAGGATGIGQDGVRISDVHHRDHPDSKFRGENGLSIGFTSHYDLMRARFPRGLGDGAAGENILVASDRTWSAADLAGGVTIATAGGVLVSLSSVVVADPCVEFARWLLEWPEEERPTVAVAEAVAFLGGGVRGFYAGVAGKSSRARIGVGDLVYATEDADALRR